jgi:hypothetical protein
MFTKTEMTKGRQLYRTIRVHRWEIQTTYLNPAKAGLVVCCLKRESATKCPILKRGRLQKVKNLTTKWQIFDYRVGDDALDRILEILQEDDDDEDAEFEGFLPDRG